jgi:hypothetical protein
MASSSAFPPGVTFVDQLKASFVDVPVDAEHNNAIETSRFLDSAESLTTLFGESARLLCVESPLTP